MIKLKRGFLLRLAAPLIALLAAIAASSVFLLMIGHNPFTVFTTLIAFSLGRSDSIGALLFNATPLIFSGLAVVVGLKAGLFNIGVEGQYVIGAFCAAWVAFSLQGLPSYIHLPLAVAAAMGGAMLWSFFPAYLKLRRGVHEVISTIMFNYVAYSLLQYLVTDLFMDRNQNIPSGLASPLIRTPHFAQTALAPKMHGFFRFFGLDIPDFISLNWFFALALLTAALVYYFLWFTPLGFELRVLGLSPEAAESAGIRTPSLQMKGFLISGALAGLVGLSHLLGYYDSFDLDFPKGYGFTGIAVALMANNHPLGLVPAALLFGLLNRGAEGIQTYLAVPMELTVILQGCVILSIAVTLKWAERIAAQEDRKEG